jgi:hypothetical protein
MKLTTEYIRQLIKEEIDTATEPKTRLSMTSIDDQIDSLFIKFEKESIKEEPDGEEPAEEEPVEESRRIRSLAQLMFEAPEDDEEAEPAEEAPADEEPTSVGSEERDEEWSAEPQKPPIDMDQFVQRIVRLVENYNSLLDIPTVIVQRAENYIQVNYDDAAAQDFSDKLEMNHGISLNPKDNATDTPAAIGAGPGGI